MTTSIRELKRRYKINLALGRALPTFDLGIAMPISTGRPLFDAALVEKLTPTATLTESEHLNRVWQLVRSAPREDLALLGEHANGLLNDAKLLIALRAFADGEGQLTKKMLAALPWGWRFAFPTAVIKPAGALFTGWRRSLEFRLIEPRFDALRELFRELLSEASGVAIQKYRRSIQQSAALLKFRFEGERERAIHDFCFEKGDSAIGIESLEPIGTSIRARNALAAGGARAMLDLLEASPRVLPITTYMGLLGGAGIRLTNSEDPAPALRDYAIRSATVVESLLRLAEWSPWLEQRHAEALSEKVRQAVLERGFDVPFFKIVRAFTAAPLGVRKMVLEPMLLPLLRHFGKSASRLLPPPGPLTFVQPGNVIHIMSFMLASVLSSAIESRMLLLYAKGAEEVEPIPLEEMCKHLADGGPELQRWLLGRFGGLAAVTGYTYDYSAIGKALKKLDHQAPIVLDLPFAESSDVLDALMPFERVFNLNSAYGAPGEVCIAYEYYLAFFMGTRAWNYGIWERYSDKAAERFTEFLDRLGRFQALAAHVPEASLFSEVSP